MIDNLFNAVLWKLHLMNIRKKGKITIKNRKNLSIKGKIKVLNGTLLDADGRIEIGSGLICEYSKLLAAGGYIKIGQNVQIGDFCFFTGQGGLDIGNDVLFASKVNLIPNEHCWDDITRPIMKQGQKSKPITIGDGCWFGINCTVLGGSTIGKNCVIAAHSVVKGEFPDYCVIAGVPARIVKKYDNLTKSWERILNEK